MVSWSGVLRVFLPQTDGGEGNSSPDEGYASQAELVTGGTALRKHPVPQKQNGAE